MPTSRVIAFIVLLFSTCVAVAQTPNGIKKAEWKAFLKQGVERKVDCKSRNVEKAIEAAEDYIGVKHCMGGTTKKCIDCSGLVKTAFAEAGCEIEGRTAQDIAMHGKLKFDSYGLKKGDLVFFANTYRSDNLVTHVGIVVEPGKFIHASSSRGVMVSDFLNGYWADHFIFGTVL